MTIGFNRLPPTGGPGPQPQEGVQRPRKDPDGFLSSLLDRLDRKSGDVAPAPVPAEPPAAPATQPPAKRTSADRPSVTDLLWKSIRQDLARRADPSTEPDRPMPQAVTLARDDAATAYPGPDRDETQELRPKGINELFRDSITSKLDKEYAPQPATGQDDPWAVLRRDLAERARQAETEVLARSVARGLRQAEGPSPTPLREVVVHDVARARQTDLELSYTLDKTAPDRTDAGRSARIESLYGRTMAEAAARQPEHRTSLDAAIAEDAAARRQGELNLSYAIRRPVSGEVRGDVLGLEPTSIDELYRDSIESGLKSAAVEPPAGPVATVPSWQVRLGIKQYEAAPYEVRMPVNLSSLTPEEEQAQAMVDLFQTAARPSLDIKI